VTDFRFGRFELDSRTRELRKDGVEGPALLQTRQRSGGCLIDVTHPGELLTRDELRDQLLARRHVRRLRARTERRIKRLRSVLGDNAERPRSSRRCTAGYRSSRASSA
jgi:DNA-binding winged helix-turn-helix (wHTH) protein